MAQPACLEKMISLRKGGCSPQKSWTSKSPTNSSSYRSNHRDHKDTSRPIKPLIRCSETLEFDVVQFTKRNLQQIIQLILQALILKKWSSKNKLKAKSLDVYCAKSHLEYYNFCHRYKNYFATVKATRPNKIPFAIFLFWDQINIC